MANEKHRRSSVSSKFLAEIENEKLTELAPAFFTASQLLSLRTYLDKIRLWHGYARFIGLPALVETSKDVPLDRLYVLPRLSRTLIQPETMNDSKSILSTLDLLDTLVSNKRLVVLGDPGSGKSTLVNFISDSLARPMVGELTKLLGDGIIPLPFVLRELNIDENISWETLLGAFLSRPTGQALGTSDKERHELFEALMQSGKGWVLLDGIDEIGNARSRQALKTVYEHIASVYSNARFLITSRVVGYDEVPFDNTYTEPSIQENFEDFVHGNSSFPSSYAISYIPNKTLLTERFYLTPFNDGQVRDFARNWWLHHRGNPALAAAEAEDFLSALHAKEDTRTLSRVPNLLVLIALVYKVLVKLPDGRADLYSKIAEAYLENIDRAYQLSQRLPYSHQQMTRWLAHVAWVMQCRRHRDAAATRNVEADIKKTTSEILITHDEAKECLAIAIVELEGKAKSEAEVLAGTFLDYVARRSGLFIPRGEDAEHRDLYAFMHLSFQEFFCAVHLLDKVGRLSWWKSNVLKAKDRSAFSLKMLRVYASHSEWADVFVFLFEMLKLGDADKPLVILRALLGEDEGTENWAEFDAPFPRVIGSSTIDIVKKGKRVASSRVVELVATLAMNSEVSIAHSARANLILRCWQWECERCQDKKQLLNGSNAVARALTARRVHSPVSWGRLQTLRKTVRSLSLSGCTAVTNLETLSTMTSLVYLVLSDCTSITSLSPLEKVSELREIYLNGCTSVTDFSPLSQLRALKVCEIRDSSFVEDLSFLSSLESLEEANLSGCSTVSCLKPLASLHGLRTLSLGRCTALIDIAPISNLFALETLNIRGCSGIVDLSPLSELSRLMHLDISHCTTIANMAPIAKLLSLRSLDAKGCERVADISHLASLVSLTSLDLNGCIEIGNVNALTQLTSLEDLSLQRCSGISDIGPLASLSLLKYLDIRDCVSIKNLSPLSSLQKLKFLFLSGCLEVSDLAPLTKLPDLKYLLLSPLAARKNKATVDELRDRGVHILFSQK